MLQGSAANEKSFLALEQCLGISINCLWSIQSCHPWREIRVLLLQGFPWQALWCSRVCRCVPGFLLASGSFWSSDFCCFLLMQSTEMGIFLNATHRGLSTIQMLICRNQISQRSVLTFVFIHTLFQRICAKPCSTPRAFYIVQIHPWKAERSISFLPTLSLLIPWKSEFFLTRPHLLCWFFHFLWHFRVKFPFLREKLNCRVWIGAFFPHPADFIAFLAAGKSLLDLGVLSSLFQFTLQVQLLAELLLDKTGAPFSPGPH